MRRDQLEHAIRTACRVIDRQDVIVVGSQSILATYREEDLPAAATRSLGVDILPMAADGVQASVLVERLEGAAGEFSPFEQLHGIRIEGADARTSILPRGWRDRLVRFPDGSPAARTGEGGGAGWCLDSVDLCVARLCAFREKDRNFVTALVDHGLVTAAAVSARLDLVPGEHRAAVERARSWLSGGRLPPDARTEG
ncbi:MAG: hypothetical protein QJR09_05870 [Micrococcus sp.]|nr:hypothetical protein [Micrococcus sp.]